MEFNDFRITINALPINADFYRLRLVINRAQPRNKLFEMISHMVSKDLVDHRSLNTERITDEKIEEDDGTTATKTVKLLED